MSAKPDETMLPDLYRFDWKQDSVVLALERVHEARGGDLTAELHVTTTRNGPEQLLHLAKLNLVSAQTRAATLRSLRERIPDETFDWGAAMEYVVHRSLQQWRQGEPTVDLRTVEPRTGGRFLLEPYIEASGTSVIFAMGGSGKSLFGLAIACSVAAGIEILGKCPTEMGPVLYLDWEADKWTHAERLRALCAGNGLDLSEAPIHYRRQSASLAESAPSLRRLISELGIVLIIVDSLGAARGGEPESADSTIRLFNAARSLSVPWIGIDHVTKNGGPDQSTPFGSVYTHNEARMTWLLEQVDDEQPNGMTVRLTNKKVNNGRKLGRQTYRVEMREDEADRLTYLQYRGIDERDVAALFPRLKLNTQIAAVLKERGPLRLKEIVDALADCDVVARESAVANTLTRNATMFARKDGYSPPIWGLLASYV